MTDLGCENEKAFPKFGAGYVASYFTKGENEGECKISQDMTGYSMYAPDDYKRCVCDSWGNGASDCP